MEYVSDVYFSKTKDALKNAYLKEKIPLVNELADINAKINAQASIDDSVIRRLKQEYKNLQQQRFYSKNVSERNALAKAMELKSAEIEAYNAANMNPAISDAELKALYDTKASIYSKLKKLRVIMMLNTRNSLKKLLLQNGIVLMNIVVCLELLRIML